MDRIFVIGRDPVPAHIRVEAGESLRWTFLMLPSAMPQDLNVVVDLCGRDASADLAGLYLCSGGERLKMNVTVRHSSGGCRSEQLFKGIAGGGARAEFDGLIHVAEGSAGTKAYQASHAILLDNTALVETRPQLEIYNDDVECSHGATTGFLNPEELFYMRSRGIPEDEARQLQMLSFISPVLRRLPEDLCRLVMESMKSFAR